MNNEQESVIRKIKALLSKTQENGASEGEAMNAMAAAGQLLKNYNLSMDAVFLGEQSCVTMTINTGSNNSGAISGIIVALGAFCDCRVWTHKATDNLQYKFFGLESDTEMAKYLYDIIDRAIEQETANFKMTAMYLNPQYGTSRKTLSTSFQKGMVYRIHERLEEMTQNRYEDAPTPMNAETDMVLIKQNKVEDEFEKLGLKLRRIKRYSRVANSGAYGAGSLAGNKVNINRPVGANAGGMKLLA